MRDRAADLAARIADEYIGSIGGSVQNEDDLRDIIERIIRPHLWEPADGLWLVEHAGTARHARQIASPEELARLGKPWGLVELERHRDAACRAVMELPYTRQVEGGYHVTHHPSAADIVSAVFQAVAGSRRAEVAP